MTKLSTSTADIRVFSASIRAAMTLAVFATVPIGPRLQLVETDAATDYRIERTGI